MAWLDLRTGETAPPFEIAFTAEATTTDEALGAAASAPVLGIRFSRFGDGRGFSLARIARERFQFSGTLVALGPTLPDQAAMLRRCGFDIAEIVDERRLEAARRTLARFDAYYQRRQDGSDEEPHGDAAPPANRVVPASPSMAAGPLVPNPDPGGPPLTSDGQEIATVPVAIASTAIADLDAALGETDSLDERLRLIAEAIPGRIAFATSLQKEDQAILDAIARTGIAVDVFTLDTGRLFPEVLETVERTEARYGLRVRLVAPEAQAVEALVARDGALGFRRSVENRHRCCNIRKVEPLKKALAGACAWITGIRRDQTGTRSDVPFAAFDAADGLVKFNPIADWSLDRLDGTLRSNDVPINPMQERGFPSVGCQTCTRAIGPGEDIRAGRWWWERDDHKECGLHWARDPDDPTVDRPGADVTEKVAA